MCFHIVVLNCDLNLLFLALFFALLVHLGKATEIFPVWLLVKVGGADLPI